MPNKNEIAKQVARIRRLFQVGKLDMELANLILTGHIKIRKLPKLQAMQKMGHKKLLLVLRQCPESPLFNKCKITVSKRTVPVKKALKMVQEVILDNFRMAEMESIKEAKASDEYSNRANWQRAAAAQADVVIVGNKIVEEIKGDKSSNDKLIEP